MEDDTETEADYALRATVQKAEDELYGHLDAYGGTKRIASLISRLIDAKIAEALATLPLTAPNERK